VGGKRLSRGKRQWGCEDMLATKWGYKRGICREIREGMAARIGNTFVKWDDDCTGSSGPRRMALEAVGQRKGKVDFGW